MTALSKRKTRPLASLCSSMSKAPREWLPTKSWSSTSAKTKPPAIFPLQKTWERAPLHLQHQRQRRLQLRPSPSLVFSRSSVEIASPVPRSGNFAGDRASVFFVPILRCQVGPCFFPLETAPLFLSFAFSCSPRPLFLNNPPSRLPTFASVWTASTSESS